MQLERNPFRPRPRFRALLGTLLVLLLLVSATFAANHAFHRFVHNDEAGQGYPCLVCSIAKGQITTADIAFAAPLFPDRWLPSLAWMPVAPRPSFDYRLSPSRAPPRR